MNYTGVEEVSFYRGRKSYAAHVAVFEGGEKKTYVAI